MCSINGVVDGLPDVFRSSSGASREGNVMIRSSCHHWISLLTLGSSWGPASKTPQPTLVWNGLATGIRACRIAALLPPARGSAPAEEQSQHSVHHQILLSLIGELMKQPVVLLVISVAWLIYLGPVMPERGAQISTVGYSVPRSPQVDSSAQVLARYSSPPPILYLPLHIRYIRLLRWS